MKSATVLLLLCHLCVNDGTEEQRRFKRTLYGNTNLSLELKKTVIVTRNDELPEIHNVEKIETVSSTNDSIIVPKKMQHPQCSRYNCPKKKGNGRCDTECNTYDWEFDGHDCSLGINPWVNCTQHCWVKFMDDTCNEDCNNPQCLFDGYDCETTIEPCNPVYAAYCKKHYANNRCDYGCNVAGCNWDGLDCEVYPPEFADGVVTVVVLMDMQEFKKKEAEFLREMGQQLRTNVRVKKDRHGQGMIYPWRGNSDYSRKRNNSYTQQEQSGIRYWRLTTGNVRPLKDACKQQVQLQNFWQQKLRSTGFLHPSLYIK